MASRHANKIPDKSAAPVVEPIAMARLVADATELGTFVDLPRLLGLSEPDDPPAVDLGVPPSET